MKKILQRIWLEFMRFFISTWYVWLAVIIGLIIHLIFGGTAGIFTFFGIVLAFILFIFFRQFYWWFTGKVDFVGGGFPKLWKKIFKK